MSESKEIENGENGGSKKQKKPLFPVEIEIKLLEELLEFQQETGSFSWQGFYDATSQKSAYNLTQIYELMRRLKAAYLKTRSHPPPESDAQRRRVHDLSAALWSSCPDAAESASASATTRKRKRRRGGSAPIEPRDFPAHFPLVSEYFNNARVPELLRSHWIFMGSAAAQEFERRRRELKVAQLRLYEENLGLNKDMSVAVAEIIKRGDVNPSTSSSSSTT